MNTAAITSTTGPTEREILAILWEHGPLTVRQVRAILQKHRPIAYTTILTVSGRMEEKGLLLRTTMGAPYNGTRTLTPAVSRAELIAHAVMKVCSDFGVTATDCNAVLVTLGCADA